MSLHIDQRKEHRELIFAVSGSLDSPESADVVRTAVGKALADGHATMLVDLSKVDAESDSGVAKILAKNFVTEPAGRSLRITGAVAADCPPIEESEWMPGDSKPFDILEFVRDEGKDSEPLGTTPEETTLDSEPEPSES